MISNYQCKNYYGNSIKEGMLCTMAAVGEGLKGPCVGDEGGPLVRVSGSGDGVTPGQNYWLIGVSSWSAYPCNGISNPAVFARWERPRYTKLTHNFRVTSQLAGIQQITQFDKGTCPPV